MISRLIRYLTQNIQTSIIPFPFQITKTFSAKTLFSYSKIISSTSPISISNFLRSIIPPETHKRSQNTSLKQVDFIHLHAYSLIFKHARIKILHNFLRKSRNKLKSQGPKEKIGNTSIRTLRKILLTVARKRTFSAPTERTKRRFTASTKRRPTGKSGIVEFVIENFLS